MVQDILEVRNIYKSFGQKVVLKDINFSVYENELFFILGPSGCGKTTLLRIIAGFTEPDSGKIILNKRDITKLPPNKRNIGFVFQNYALWPHMTVKENIEYGLKIKKYSKDFIEKRVKEIIDITRLNGTENLYPSQISGGQQQRVALARAMVVNPTLLLLDEPLSNLDARLRDELRTEIKRIKREIGMTMIYVTHDQKDAMILGTRIAVMGDGEILQIGNPYEIYTEPVNLFVANFIGDINVLKGNIIEKDSKIGKVQTEEGLFLAKIKKDFAQKEIFLCFRPEDVIPNSEINNIIGRMEDYEFLGDTLKINVKTDKGNRFKITIPVDMFDRFAKGEKIIFSIRREKIILLEK